MFFRPIIPAVFALSLFPLMLFGQTSIKSPALDSMNESHILIFRQVGITDTAKAIVRVLVKETGRSGEAIQGATVLLRRDKDKMLGRVSRQDGRCNFMPTPSEYSVRVQLTGYKSLERSGLIFLPGKVYELELRIARN